LGEKTNSLRAGVLGVIAWSVLACKRGHFKLTTLDGPGLCREVSRKKHHSARRFPSAACYRITHFCRRTWWCLGGCRRSVVASQSLIRGKAAVGSRRRYGDSRSPPLDGGSAVRFWILRTRISSVILHIVLVRRTSRHNLNSAFEESPQSMTRRSLLSLWPCSLLTGFIFIVSKANPLKPSGPP
jgi:hypothetical protein